MAITNRDALKPGVKLIGKYKGVTYRADVVDVEGETRYRLEVDGKDYKSTSSAGAAVFSLVAGKPRTCNGFDFWSIDGDEAPVNPAPAPATQGTRARKPKAAAVSATEPVAGDTGADDAAPAETFACGECEAEFPTQDEVVAHYDETHGQVEAAS